MSGTNRLVNNENALQSASESALTSSLMNSNEVAKKKDKKGKKATN